MITFRRKKKDKPVLPTNPSAQLYRAVWERQQLPSPGAMNYAYETLALQPVSPISGAVAVRAPITAQILTPMVYGPFKMGTIQGTPIVSGGIKGQPLYNPVSGYSGPWPYSDNAAFAKVHGIAPAGEII